MSEFGRQIRPAAFAGLRRFQQIPVAEHAPEWARVARILKHGPADEVPFTTWWPELFREPLPGADSLALYRSGDPFQMWELYPGGRVLYYDAEMAAILTTRSPDG